MAGASVGPARIISATATVPAPVSPLIDRWEWATADERVADFARLAVSVPQQLRPVGQHYPKETIATIKKLARAASDSETDAATVAIASVLARSPPVLVPRADSPLLNEILQHASPSTHRGCVAAIVRQLSNEWHLTKGSPSSLSSRLCLALALAATSAARTVIDALREELDAECAALPHSVPTFLHSVHSAQSASRSRAKDQRESHHGSSLLTPPLSALSALCLSLACRTLPHSELIAWLNSIFVVDPGAPASRDCIVAAIRDDRYRRMDEARNHGVSANGTSSAGKVRTPVYPVDELRAILIARASSLRFDGSDQSNITSSASYNESDSLLALVCSLCGIAGLIVQEAEAVAVMRMIWRALSSDKRIEPCSTLDRSVTRFLAFTVLCSPTLTTLLGNTSSNTTRDIDSDNATAGEAELVSSPVSLAYCLRGILERLSPHTLSHSFFYSLYLALARRSVAAVNTAVRSMLGLPVRAESAAVYQLAELLLHDVLPPERAFVLLTAETARSTTFHVIATSPRPTPTSTVAVWHQCIVKGDATIGATFGFALGQTIARVMEFSPALQSLIELSAWFGLAVHPVTSAGSSSDGGTVGHVFERDTRVLSEREVRSLLGLPIALTAGRTDIQPHFAGATLASFMSTTSATAVGSSIPASSHWFTAFVQPSSVDRSVTLLRSALTLLFVAVNDRASAEVERGRPRRAVFEADIDLFVPVNLIIRAATALTGSDRIETITRHRWPNLFLESAKLTTEKPARLKVSEDELAAGLRAILAVPEERAVMLLQQTRIRTETLLNSPHTALLDAKRRRLRFLANAADLVVEHTLPNILDALQKLDTNAVADGRSALVSAVSDLSLALLRAFGLSFALRCCLALSSQPHLDWHALLARPWTMVDDAHPAIGTSLPLTALWAEINAAILLEARTRIKLTHYTAVGREPGQDAEAVAEDDQLDKGSSLTAGTNGAGVSAVGSADSKRRKLSSNRPSAFYGCVSVPPLALGVPGSTVPIPSSVIDISESASDASDRASELAMLGFDDHVLHCSASRSLLFVGNGESNAADKLVTLQEWLWGSRETKSAVSDPATPALIERAQRAVIERLKQTNRALSQLCESDAARHVTAH